MDLSIHQPTCTFECLVSYTILEHTYSNILFLHSKCLIYSPIQNNCVEIARDNLHRLGTFIVIGGVISPVHDGYGKKELESSTHRIAMLKFALQNHSWVKLSNWECKQETWCKTKQVLQHYQVQHIHG